MNNRCQFLQNDPHPFLDDFERRQVFVDIHQEDCHFQILYLEFTFQAVFLKAISFPDDSLDAVSVNCLFKVTGTRAKSCLEWTSQFIGK